MDRDSEAGGKQEPDTREITEEMIAAGACEVSSFDPREDDPGAAAILIYEAMERVRVDTRPIRVVPDANSEISHPSWPDWQACVRDNPDVLAAYNAEEAWKGTWSRKD